MPLPRFSKAVMLPRFFGLGIDPLPQASRRRQFLTQLRPFAKFWARDVNRLLAAAPYEGRVRSDFRKFQACRPVCSGIGRASVHSGGTLRPGRGPISQPKLVSLGHELGTDLE
jgi:hypothetical protein